MSLPATLFRYIARQFVVWFATVSLLILLLIFIGNFLELTRRAAARPDIPMRMLLKLAALQMPQIAEDILPIAVLLGAILALWRLTRSQELVVARAAGISVWQFLTPAIALAFLLGTVSVLVFSPIASAMEATYKQLDNRLLRNQADSLLLNNSGLWLRQSDSEGTQAVIHALKLSQPGTELGDVTIFFFRDRDTLVRRIDAPTARLEQGRWRLTNAWTWQVESQVPQYVGDLVVPTNLTEQKIEESFAEPETMSFWALPGFIELLEQSGFSAQKHKVYFDSMLARPFLLCAMVLISAIFSLRMQRRGGVTAMLIAGVVAGFILWFGSEVLFALGNSATIPVVLAAWTPAGISTLLGTTFLLHLEDG